MSITIALCIASARTGYSVEICRVISPKRFEKLHSFPLNVVVQFSQGARPDTFRASLNGIDITTKFKKIEDGVRAVIGPEDGLRIEVKRDPQQKINVLRTRVKALKPEQHVDFETFFFVEVDKLVTVGSEGGVVKSLDGHILIDIPEHALSSTTTIALTRVHGSGQIGPVYQLAPEGVYFNQPVTVTMKYDPTNLPPGVIGDDLFLISGNEFPRRLENLLVDKTAHAVSGTIMAFSKVSMSYYMRIGKKLTDIPPATGFRLPNRNYHQGLPIHAITDGLVIFNGRGYGNTIVLAHRIPSGAILSVYSHMGEKSPCAVGTVVHKGNVIGKIGRIGTADAYLHYEIGKQSLIKVDPETGEIKVPATWFGESTQDSIYENYYDPTNFLFNIMGKYRWDFNVNGNDEGWIAKSVKKYENGYMYQVRDGMLSVKPRSSKLRIVSYPLKIEAESFDSVFIRTRSNAPDGHGKVYFATGEEPQYSEDKALEFEILNDGKFHEYRVLMGDHHKWKGTIVGIRIDVLDSVIAKTTEIKFDHIRLGLAYLSRTPDTGLTKCYDNNQEVTCPGPNDPFYGQDAHYAINPPGYEVKTINGDKVVIDHVTGLTWQRHNDGIKRTWTEAMDYCENLTLTGYSDWRLPTKKELQSIASYKIPAGFYDCYWSATTRAFLALSAWKVCFRNSQVKMSIKSDYNYVRAVRGRPLEFCHFKDNGDGTVTDVKTGLMWQQTETSAMTWEKALAFCENLDLAGYHDWRLPNIRELLSLVDDSRRQPSIDTAYFPGCRPSIYWSSTTYSLYPGFAWYVGFNDGQVHGGGHKGRRNYVRAVRGDD